MPKDPPTKIKVTEMSRILKTDDDSVFLVIQNGVGHKISFSDLKNSIVSDLKDQIISEDDKIEQLAKKYYADILSLSTDVTNKFNEHYSTLSTLFNIYSENISQDNYIKLDSYVVKAEAKLQELREEMDDKKLSKISSKNSEISRKFEAFKKDTTKKLSEICENINIKYNDLSEKLENISEKFDKSASTSVEQQNNINLKMQSTYNQLTNDIFEFKNYAISNFQNLSTAFDEFDIKLYGLTINDVDLNDKQLITEHIKYGDIEVLSSKISLIEEKLNNSNYVENNKEL